MTTTAKDLVQRLVQDAKMTPAEISEALDGRVSERTIYRWGNGDSSPQNSTDLIALEELTKARCEAT